MTKGKLEVLLVDAKGIKEREGLCGKSFLSFFEGLCGCLFCLNPCNAIKVRPYVVIQYGHQELTSSVADREGKKLVWDEKLSFSLEYPGVEDQIYKLRLQVMDKRKVSQHNLVGETVIYMKDVLALGVEKGKAELRAQKYRVVLPNKTYCGEISVAATFTVNVEV